MIIKRILKISVVFIIIFIGLWGFYHEINKEFSNTKVRLKFGATYMDMNNPFFIKLNEGIKRVVENDNGKLVVLNSQYDINKQIAEVNDLISEKVDLIFLNPVDWIKIKPALEAAKRANIPVIVVDSPVLNDELVDCTVSSDNYNAGVICARDMIKRLGGKGDIAILNHPSAKSSIDRIKGFEDTIKKYSEVKVVARESSNGQLVLAMAAMDKILQSKVKLKAIMCLNDPTALGAIAAIENNQRLRNVYIYGIDGSADALTMIESGKLTATAAQFPGQIGKIAAEEALKKLKGEKIPHDIKIQVKLIDKSNVYSSYGD
jgi:ribose transport system substrate-binding protein